MKKLLLAIDQGTTGTTAIILDDNLNVLSKVNKEFKQIYPQPGWVEHNLNDIWKSTEISVSEAILKAGIKSSDFAAIGITNQRETTCCWNRVSYEQLHNAIVWQCRRTADICTKLKDKGYEDKFKQKTGLVLDPYFSGTKMSWLIENDKNVQRLIDNGDAVFGTIDSYLVYRLTSGAAYVTDVSNASRTLLMNLKSLKWDKELAEILGIPISSLPQICDSSQIYGTTKGLDFLPDGIPVSGIAGDQQAALFGQACYLKGEAKCTYGTGAFLLMNTGNDIVYSKSGLLTTVAWKIKDEVNYALEGSAFIAGAIVQWLRDGLKIIDSADEIEELAAQVEDSGGVVLVPALVGLGSPYWKPEARGVITGITRGTTQAHFARAALEGIALQNYDILESMSKDLGEKLKTLKVDGGASANNLLMQFQADILGVEIVRPQMLETTALGAAILAGLAVEVWSNTDHVKEHWKMDKSFNPSMEKNKVDGFIKGWHKTVSKA